MYHMYRTDNFSSKTENVRIYKHRFTIKKLFGGGVAIYSKISHGRLAIPRGKSKCIVFQRKHHYVSLQREILPSRTFEGMACTYIGYIPELITNIIHLKI